VLSAIRDSFQGERFEAEHPEQYPRFIEDESGLIRVDDAVLQTPSYPAEHGGAGPSSTRAPA
jgi:hypothetical protein